MHPSFTKEFGEDILNWFYREKNHLGHVTKQYFQSWETLIHGTNLAHCLIL